MDHTADHILGRLRLYPAIHFLTVGRGRGFEQQAVITGFRVAVHGGHTMAIEYRLDDGRCPQPGLGGAGAVDQRQHQPGTFRVQRDVLTTAYMGATGQHQCQQQSNNLFHLMLLIVNPVLQFGPVAVFVVATGIQLALQRQLPGIAPQQRTGEP